MLLFLLLKLLIIVDSQNISLDRGCFHEKEVHSTNIDIHAFTGLDTFSQ